MSKHPDDQITPELVERMNDLAAMLDEYFNGQAMMKNPKYCFVLGVFKFGDDPDRFNYISNGRRKDIVTLLKEIVARFEGQSETPAGHA